MPQNEHKKVLRQLSEAYNSVYNEGLPGVTAPGGAPPAGGGAAGGSQQIPSEELDALEPRAIFVGTDSFPYFQETIQEKGLGDLNIQFLQAAWKPKLGVIVVPGEAYNTQIDDLLHPGPDASWPGDEMGFWGQSKVGYAGKQWIPVV